MNFMYRDYGMEAVTRQKSLEQNRVAKMKQFEQVKMQGEIEFREKREIAKYYLE